VAGSAAVFSAAIAGLLLLAPALALDREDPGDVAAEALEFLGVRDLLGRDLETQVEHALARLLQLQRELLLVLRPHLVDFHDRTSITGRASGGSCARGSGACGPRG